MTTPQITIRRLRHLHSHFREADVLPSYLDMAYRGGSSVVGGMPNLKVPLTTADRLLAYLKAAEAAIPTGRPFTFVPIAYLNEKTTFEMMVEFMKVGAFHFKVYPRYRTTQSEDGVVNYYPIIEIVRRAAIYAREVFGKKLYVHFHPEHPHKDFIGRVAEFVFLVVAEMFLVNTEAIIVWEHGTDGECIIMWKKFAETGRFFLTITPHHLIENEDTAGGMINALCKPPYRREPDRQALVALIAEDHPWVMLGPDDAPHDEVAKRPEDGCGCAFGAYHAFCLPEVCAHALDPILKKGEQGRVTFQNFTGDNAERNFDLPPTTETITLERRPFRIPMRVSVGGKFLVIPYRAGKELLWSRIGEEAA